MTKYEELETWEDTLEYFYKKYGETFQVQLLDKFPHKRLVYKTDEYKRFIKKYRFVNQRTRMIDEIVFDIDINKDFKDKGISLKWDFSGKSAKIAENVAKIILGPKLDEDWVSHFFFKSGGDGGHLHAFVNGLKYVNNKLDRRELKRRLIRYYAYGHLTKSKNKPFHICSQGSCPGDNLVALENAKSRKGKDKKIAYYKTHDMPSRINPLVITKFLEYKDRLKHAKPPRFKSNDMPSCIKYILYEDFKSLQDGRKRAVFILVNYFKTQGFSDEEIFNKISEWRNYTLNYDRIKDELIKSTIRSSKGLVVCRYTKGLLEELGMKKLCKGCKGWSKNDQNTFR